MDEDKNFWIYIAISTILHLLVFILFHFGLPSLWRSDPPPQIVTFEILPVDSISNVKTQKIQKEKEIEEDKAKKVQKTKAEEAPSEDDKKEVEKTKEESKRDPEEKKPEDKKDVVVIKPKKEEKKPEDKKKSDKISEKEKAVKKKPKIPQKKKLPTEKDIDALLKTLEKASEGKEAKSKKQATSARSDAKEESQGNFDEEKPLSISEEQAIRQQIQDKWNVPIGVQSADEIIITLYIAIKIDGTVEQVKIVDQQCPPSAGVVCRAAIDSAVRAVWQASPFQNLPKERYNVWKAFNISFDPKEVLGM